MGLMGESVNKMPIKFALNWWLVNKEWIFLGLRRGGHTIGIVTEI